MIPTLRRHYTPICYTFSSSSSIFVVVICADCGEREAAIFIRRSGGLEGDLALCEACARTRGLVAGPGGLDFRLDGLIATALGVDGNAGVSERGAASDSRLQASGRVACPICGTELSTIASEGRVGCARCVDVFRQRIEKLLAARDSVRPSPRFEGQESFARSLTDREAAPRAGGEEVSLSSLSPASDLARALAEEDYEKAARIRDAQARGPTAQASPDAGSLAFSLCRSAIDSAAMRSGPEDDVVLETRVRVSRNFCDLPFPGSPSGGPTPSRGRVASRFAALPGWTVRTMADIAPADRLALSERASLPRSYVSDSGAMLATCPGEALIALEDETDHIRAIAYSGGLDPRTAVAGALGAVERFAEGDFSRFARDEAFGWICSRLEDCGPGLAVSALVHLPAIAMAGMQDRLFRRLMASGIQVRGVYAGVDAEGPASEGALYELVANGAAGNSPEALSFAIEAAARASAEAERRARSEIAHRDPLAVADAAGRALGILKYCRRLERDEAANLVSDLRLAALAGLLRGAEPTFLGSLLGHLGPGALAAASGSDGAASEESGVSLRAAFLRKAIEGAELTVKEDRCSRD